MTLPAQEESLARHDPRGPGGGLRGRESARCPELLAPISVDTLSYVGMTVLPTFIVYGGDAREGT